MIYGRVRPIRFCAWGALMFLLACDVDLSARQSDESLPSRSSTSFKSRSEALAVKTYQGQITFRNSLACDESDCRRYSRLESPLKRYVFVKAEENEATRIFGIDTLLGEVRSMNGEPKFNASRSAFITTSHDEMNGNERSDGTFLWSIDEEDGLHLVRHFPLSAIAQPRLLSWASDTCARLSGMSGWGTGHHSSAKLFSIRRVGPEWQLSETPCN